MPNSINSLSPSFRDYLLLKNLVTDTVVDNSLQSLLAGIGYPASIETLPNAVLPSNSINDTGIIFQQSNTGLNTFQGGLDDYSQVNIILNQSTNNTIGNQGLYNNSNELLNGQFLANGILTDSDSIRESLTSKNIYVDVPKQSVINLNTQPVPTYQNLTSYIDENNNLLVGGPGTNALDVLGGLINGQGVGLSFGGGLIANEDIRATLLGRVLGATGVINDTPLGNIGGQQLLSHIGYNAAFGLQQETLGNLNLNPLTLFQGKPLVTLNYSITVPKGKIGKTLNYASNILGTQSPVSLLEQSSSIFTFSDKLEYIGQGNIERANEMLLNSGMGQVQSLMNHMRANLTISNPDGTNLRQGYAPGYKDGRKTNGVETGDGINFKLYVRDNGEGGIIDFLNGKANSPITSGNYARSKQIRDDGWNKDYFRVNDYNSQKGGSSILYRDAWGWGDKTFNKDSTVETNLGSDTLFEGTEKNKKSILYKTQQLFNSGNMRTLITGHGVRRGSATQISSAVSSVGNYTSKGSGVMSGDAIKNRTDDGPENVFCRTWTTYDRYSQVLDLQKHRGLYNDDESPYYRGNVGASVLDDNGFVKITPYNHNPEVKKYMFSIENLAWADKTTNLLPCEIGPGDTVSGLKGRIMWFPPYDISFNENVTASWDKHNFIGRGEPIYTYNNTERTGNLSWKIIIDHPRYLNFLKNRGDVDNDYLASYFAGCLPMEVMESLTTAEERAKEDIINKQNEEVINIIPVKPPESFDVYFPNDVFSGITPGGVYEKYENGLTGTTENSWIDRSVNLNGEGFGLVTYNEQCYKFKNRSGNEQWSSIAGPDCCKVNNGKSGRLEPDRTNFGLNATGYTKEFKVTTLNGKTYPSWRDSNYLNDLKTYLRDVCPACKIIVKGYASTAGENGDRNKVLSGKRANYIKDFLLNNVINNDDPVKDKRVVIPEPQIITEAEGSIGKGCPVLPEKERIARESNYTLSKNDIENCKVNRKVTISFEYSPELKSEIDKIKNPPIDPNFDSRINIPISRFYTECDYFNKLKITDAVVYNDIKEKIKYFQPAFHSTTPEGFNSRLTFLQQCMRQGPTYSTGEKLANGTTVNNNPNNLAFGRPPVCILRLGDFYHTKIIIENMSFQFEPLVWDLNPEGVGVQPMICTVDMSFSFIGGSSLNGAISRLQNAVSFNYYANTELYDPRADIIKIDSGKGTVIDGLTSIGAVKNTLTESKDAVGIGTGKEVDKNQVKENDKVNSGEDTQPVTGNKDEK
jgi:hypothetical protein